MIVRVRDKHNEERYFIEAAWLKWDVTTEAVTIAVYTHITRTKVVAEMNQSKIEVAVSPTIYIHVNNGDTVSVINNAGKVISQKQIIVGIENKRARRRAVAESIGMAEYDPDHQ